MTDMLIKLYDLPDGLLVRELADRRIVVRTAMAYEKHLVIGWVRFGNAWASE